MKKLHEFLCRKIIIFYFIKLKQKFNGRSKDNFESKKKALEVSARGIFVPFAKINSTSHAT